MSFKRNSLANKTELFLAGRSHETERELHQNIQIQHLREELRAANQREEKEIVKLKQSLVRPHPIPSHLPDLQPVIETEPHLPPTITTELHPHIIKKEPHFKPAIKTESHLHVKLEPHPLLAAKMEPQFQSKIKQETEKSLGRDIKEEKEKREEKEEEDKEGLEKKKSMEEERASKEWEFTDESMKQIKDRNRMLEEDLNKCRLQKKEAEKHCHGMSLALS